MSPSLWKALWASLPKSGLNWEWETAMGGIIRLLVLISVAAVIVAACGDIYPDNSPRSPLPPRDRIPYSLGR